MKKLLFIYSLLFLNFSTYAQSINHTELEPFWQDLKAALTGGYGTKIIRLSSTNFKAAQIEKMNKVVQSNRCILSAVMLGASDEIDYNPDLNEFSFIVTTLKNGKVFFRLKKNDKGFFRLINFETNGNIACPVTNIENTNLYDKSDLIGNWKFNKIDWIQKSDSLKKLLSENGHDEKLINDLLMKRVEEIKTEKPENNELIAIQEVKFTKEKMEIITKDNKNSYFWRLSYNQLQYRKTPTEQWGVWKFNWRVDKNRNLDFSIDDYTQRNRGNVEWEFIKSK
ncbi:MAG: hypothetical protein EAY69_10410 [Cytophagales bacterium]|nr:MAG: hypothetical protein EAY69_10410 [Cytophagales bacterium]